MKLIVTVIVLSSITWAQQLPDAPKPHVLRDTILSNSAMWGATLLAANATSHGTRACAVETGRAAFRLPSGENIGLAHPYRTYFARSAAINAAITAFSLWRAHRGRGSERIVDTAMGFHLGVAAVQYGAGCF